MPIKSAVLCACYCRIFTPLARARDVVRDEYAEGVSIVVRQLFPVCVWEIKVFPVKCNHFHKTCLWKKSWLECNAAEILISSQLCNYETLKNPNKFCLLLINFVDCCGCCAVVASVMFLWVFFSGSIDQSGVGGEMKSDIHWNLFTYWRIGVQNVVAGALLIKFWALELID